MYPESFKTRYLRFQFDCRVTGSVMYLPPWRGEVFKGLLANEMKKQFPCGQATKCGRCERLAANGGCHYSRFFLPHLLKKDSIPPYVYTIIPPLNPCSISYKRDLFSFEIRLFGESAQAYFLTKHFAPAIEMGGMLSGIGNWYKRPKMDYGRFQIERIHAWQERKWITVFDKESGFARHDIWVQDTQKQVERCDDRELKIIQWYTPVCFVKAKNTIQEPSLKDIVYFCVTRLKTLFQEDPDVLKLPRSLWNDLDEVRSIHSNYCEVEVTPKKRDRYFIGESVFPKIQRELLPLLTLGSLCHVGKGSSQGYGGFVLRE